MKHIIKVEVLQNLPEIRPLLAMDADGKLFQQKELPTPVVHNDEIHYTATEKITPYDTTVFGSTYLPEDSTFDSVAGEGILKFDNVITRIGDYAFMYCYGLTSVTIPNSVTSIGNEAFVECSGLTSVIIPNNVIGIGEHAFAFCTGLTSVTIGNSVASIGAAAFYNCRSLNSITIPNSVTSIGSSAFTEGWLNPILNSITFESTTPIDLVDQYDSIIRIFGNPDYLVNFAIHVPSGYENIYAEHDAGWEALAQYIVGYVPVIKTDTIFTYSDSTTSTSSDQIISQSSYDGSKTLTSVEIGTKATSIGDRTFYCCSSLTSIEIPNSVTSIGSGAFDGCYSLTSVTIPNSVTSIGGNAFWGMSVTASFMSTIPNISLQIGEEIIEPFGGSGPSSEPAEFTIIVPAGCKAAYVDKDAGWEALAAYIEEAQ